MKSALVVVSVLVHLLQLPISQVLVFHNQLDSAKHASIS